MGHQKPKDHTDHHGQGNATDEAGQKSDLVPCR